MSDLCFSICSIFISCVIVCWSSNELEATRHWSLPSSYCHQQNPHQSWCFRSLSLLWFSSFFFHQFSLPVKWSGYSCWIWFCFHTPSCAIKGCLWGKIMLFSYTVSFDAQQAVAFKGLVVSFKRWTLGFSTFVSWAWYLKITKINFFIAQILY